MTVATRDRLLSVQQVADLLNVRREYVYRLTLHRPHAAALRRQARAYFRV